VRVCVLSLTTTNGTHVHITQLFLGISFVYPLFVNPLFCGWCFKRSLCTVTVLRVFLGDSWPYLLLRLVLQHPMTSLSARVSILFNLEIWMPSGKFPVVTCYRKLSDRIANNLVTIEFKTDFRKVFIYIFHFTKFRPLISHVFLADRKKDKHTWRSCQSIFAHIRIIGVFCLSVATHTRHTGCSVHSILLQFPQHTALKATNPPADRTVVDRLKSDLMFTSLFQNTSCVMLSISSYKYPFGTPLKDKLPMNSITNDHPVQLIPSYC